MTIISREKDELNNTNTVYISLMCSAIENNVIQSGMTRRKNVRMQKLCF